MSKLFTRQTTFLSQVTYVSCTRRFWHWHMDRVYRTKCPLDICVASNYFTKIRWFFPPHVCRTTQSVKGLNWTESRLSPGKKERKGEVSSSLLLTITWSVKDSIADEEVCWVLQHQTFRPDAFYKLKPTNWSNTSIWKQNFDFCRLVSQLFYIS